MDTTKSKRGFRYEIESLTSLVNAQTEEIEFYRATTQEQMLSLSNTIDAMLTSANDSNINKDEIDQLRRELEHVEVQNGVLDGVKIELDDSLLIANKQIDENKKVLNAIREELEPVREVIRTIQKIVSGFRHELADMYRSNLFKKFTEHHQQHEHHRLHTDCAWDPYDFATKGV